MLSADAEGQEAGTALHWAPGHKEEISSNHITMVLRKLTELEVTATAAASF